MGSFIVPMLNFVWSTLLCF